MKDVLIIDGYNLLYAWAKQTEFSAADLEHARAQMLEQLANYGAYQGCKIIVVFDGRGTGGIQKITDSMVEVIFTPENQTADSYIEMLVPELVPSVQVGVVTSDYEEQRSVFGSGAVRYSSREFALLIRESKARERRHYRDRSGQANFLDHRIDGKLREILEKRRKE